MAQEKLSFPDSARPSQLLEELAALLLGLPAVCRVAAFGSLIRGTWDRWSDLDLVVVTDSPGDFADVMTGLHRSKPILDHIPLSSRSDGPGKYALSVVFENESIFHCLDLNLIAQPDANRPGALNWFGPLRDMSIRAGATVPPTPVPVTGGSAENLADGVMDDGEARIVKALYGAKKEVKRVLRGSSSLEELESSLGQLREALSELPEKASAPGRQVGQVAHTCLVIGSSLLSPQVEERSE